MEQSLKPETAGNDVAWHDAVGFTIEGRGWHTTASTYERLPEKARDFVTEKHWKHAECPAGVTVRFSTNSPTLFVKWDGLEGQQEFSSGGMDLYVRHDGKWRWLGYTKGQKPLFDQLPVQDREYRLYLPLFYQVQRVELGITKGFQIKAVPPSTQAPIVFYGTSITQGSRASRAGMTYSAILGRWLDWPVLNLGFSGSGDMGPQFMDLLCELKAKAFVLDCLPNMTAPQVLERAETAIRKLRAAHTEVPIVMVEMVYGDAFLKPHRMARSTDSNQAQHAVFQKLVREGVEHLHYLPAERLLGTDGEATIDGTHYTDLGYMRFSKKLYPLLKSLVEPATIGRWRHDATL